ncbi:hypothetical protein Tco_0313527 [Tanacetum coccineum]
MTPATPSSGLDPNPLPSAPFVAPLRHEWDLVFQLVFDEFFSPPACVASPVPVEEAPAFVESIGSPSPTTVDQDAPSLKTVSEESSSLDVISTTVHTDAPISKHLIEPKTYKDALTQSCWIEAMQEELHEFERLEVWELVPRPDKVMEEGIDFEESLALVAKLEAVRNVLKTGSLIDLLIEAADFMIFDFLDDIFDLNTSALLSEALHSESPFITSESQHLEVLQYPLMPLSGSSNT